MLTDDLKNPEFVFGLITCLRRPHEGIEVILDFYKENRYVTERQINYARKLVIEHHMAEALRRRNALPLALDARPRKVPDVQFNGLKKELRGYQQYGASFALANGGSALIADEMGLGKTMQAVAVMSTFPNDRIVVIVPASIKEQWRREILDWTDVPPRDIEILSGEVAYPTYGRILIINYDILFQNKRKKAKRRGMDWTTRLIQLKPGYIVCDEGHYLKESSSNRTKAVKRLRSTCSRMTICTGTPIENRPIEFYMLTTLVQPDIWPSKKWYQRRYCGLKKGKYGWDDSGATNTFELNQKLTSGPDAIMIRRRKCDVLKELPAKQRILVPLEIDNRDEYIKILNETEAWVRENFPDDTDRIEATQRAAALVRLNYLKQATARGKMQAVRRWIIDWLEEEPKLVVFFTHTEPLLQMKEWFGGSAVVINGSVPPDKREGIAEQFRTDPGIKLLLGNLQAAGTGLNLQCAHATAHVEFAWSPGLHDQGEDRVHRIGQERDCVFAYYLMAVDTIEETIVHLLDEKRKIVSAVLDGRKVESSDLLGSLLDELKKPTLESSQASNKPF